MDNSDKNLFEELILHKYSMHNKAYVPLDFKNNRLDINYDLFKKLKGKFVFSCFEIKEPTDKLRLVKVFYGLYWKIYLYEVI